MAELAIAIAELDDDGLVVRHLDGVDLLVCRIDDEFHAVEDRCSHARSVLHTGSRQGHIITCPLHGAKFDLRTGACLAAPAMRPITSLATRVEGDKVIVTVTDADKPAKPKFGVFN